MRVTTSLLADAATVAEGKLYIHGAGWDTIRSPAVPTTQPSMALVLVLELDLSETDPRDLEIMLVDADGTSLGVGVKGHLEIGDPSKLTRGLPIRQPIAVTFPAVTFQRAGKYRFVLSIDGDEVHSVELWVLVVPQ